MGKKKSGDTTASFACPIGRVFSTLERAARTESRFKEHLSRSRIEFLKAMKCLIDEKIEDLEKEDVTQGKKRATRIKVE